MPQNKGEACNEIRKLVGRDPVYQNEYKLRKADLEAIADTLGIDYGAGVTNADLRAIILRDTGREGTTAVDVHNGFDRLEVGRVLKAVRDATEE